MPSLSAPSAGPTARTAPGDADSFGNTFCIASSPKSGCGRRTIACRATSHRSAGNPLRHEGRLPALAGIEYAAQALAAHCALVGAGADLRADHGVLAGVRAVAMRVDRLDDIHEVLDVRAERLIADGARLLYSFVVQAGGRELLSGRVAVVLREEGAR